MLVRVLGDRDGRKRTRQDGPYALREPRGDGAHPKRQPPPKPEPGQTCTRCGERPAVSGRFSCEVCIERMEREAEEAKARKARRQARGRGACEHCGWTVEVAGHRWYAECRDRELSMGKCECCGKALYGGGAVCPECAEATEDAPREVVLDRETRKVAGNRVFRRFTGMRTAA
jgi:hypothetical protein